MLTPLSLAQWDADKAAHLLNRAGFGGTPAHVDSLARSGMAASVRYLIDGPATPAPAPAPDWAQPTDYAARREEIQAAVMALPPGADEAARQAARRRVQNGYRKQEFEHGLDLGWWWLDRMRQSVDPLEEKMTLFWHGHFATSAQKVRDPFFMYRQNQTLREHARGNFGVLVKAMSRDPAMIQWLDLRESRAAHPNENFAREVMELFTLGEGNYTEKDVTEGARAFTGYRINGRDASFQFNPREHDNTPKTVLGRPGLHLMATRSSTRFSHSPPARISWPISCGRSSCRTTRRPRSWTPSQGACGRTVTRFAPCYTRCSRARSFIPPRRCVRR